MNRKKLIQANSLLLIFCFMFSLCACGNGNGNGTSSVSSLNSSGASSAASQSKPIKAAYLKKSTIASQPARYVAIDKVGTYNKNIITDDLKNKKSTLPEASSSSIPYWTGFCSEAKIFVNSEQDDSWKNTDGSNYFYENQFKFASENGFNCMRLLYSMSYFSNPDNVMEINESELEQLDEAISWGMKYNLHIMISITGLPGKWNTKVEEENIMGNNELFLNAKLADTFKKYWVMLAKRYADIPNKNLSFELMAEPHAPDDNLKLYEDQMITFSKAIWAVSPRRILIANDLAKQLPERLAQAGLCLSLHNHIYTIDSQSMPQVSYKGHWPMEYLPSYLDAEGERVLTLKSEKEFTQGTLKIFMERQWNDFGGLNITADGKTLISGGHEKDAFIQVNIPQGAKQIKIKSANANVQLAAVQVTQNGINPIVMPVHNLYTGVDIESEKMPTILIKSDGTTQNANNPPLILNSEYFTKTYLQKFIDCAKKNHVGFLLTEVGTDTRDLTLKEYQEYESVWLDALKANHIPWMWNCLENNYSPKGRLGVMDGSVVQEDTDSLLCENKSMVDFMKKYQ